MAPNLPAILRNATNRRRIEIDTGAPLTRDRNRLLKTYLQVVRHWEGARVRLMQAYERELSALTTDSISDLQDDIEQEAGYIVSVFANLAIQIDDWASVVEWWHRGRWRNSLLSASGVDLGTVLQAGDVAQTLENVIQQNLDLIRDLDSTLKNRLTGAIFRALNERRPARELARELREITSGRWGRKRALLIASDQLQKLSSALDTERMAQTGITDFVWVHSGKVHFRPEHKARNGKRYNLRTRKAVNGGETIDASDMPGIPIYCGCRKRAIIDLEDVDDEGNPR